MTTEFTGYKYATLYFILVDKSKQTTKHIDALNFIQLGANNP